MEFAGFKPDDFHTFIFDPPVLKVAYIRDSLHPRLRVLGESLARELTASVGAELRCQLRSGRWHKTPWATWVSIISVQETVRSDPHRPRLSVFIDQHEVIIGFCHNVWPDTWQKTLKAAPGLAQAMDNAAQRGKIKVGLAYWAEGDKKGAWERQTDFFSRARDAFAAAKRIGHDFIFVGRAYPWPKEEKRLCSPAIAQESLRVLKAAWPAYHCAFFQAKGRR